MRAGAGPWIWTFIEPACHLVATIWIWVVRVAEDAAAVRGAAQALVEEESVIGSRSVIQQLMKRGLRLRHAVD